MEGLLGITGGVHCVTLALGKEVIELLEFENPGAPYPDHCSAADLNFQHFAIVVTDMAEAWVQLSRIPGWIPITKALPQRLPESAGGVTAFKFRDLEGHPLELLAFPREHTPQKWKAQKKNNCCLGIDHSAIGVSNTQQSIAFYSAMGLHLSSQSHNAGPEQDRLDGLDRAIVDVTGLAPDSAGPHVELLYYQPHRAVSPPLNANDIAARDWFLKAMEPVDLTALLIQTTITYCCSHLTSY